MNGNGARAAHGAAAARPGQDGASAAVTGAYVEARRLRTWQEDAPPDVRRRWFLVAKAQFLRYRRSWVFWTIISLGIALTLSAMVAPFGSMEYGGGIAGEVITYGLLPAAAMLVMLAILLAAAPAIADDIRFQAPLYYFSRPLTTRDYLIGKIVFVTALTLILVVPAILMLGIVGIGTWSADGPPPPLPPGPFAQPYEQQSYEQALAQYRQTELPNWQATHMDHFGDWLFTLGILLVGSLVSAAYLGSLTLFLSAWTTRGWHAALAIVVALVGLGVLGGNLGALLTGGEATGLVFSPAMWPYAVTALPLETYYNCIACERGFDRQVPATYLLSMLVMTLATVGLYRLTFVRLRRFGGQA